MYPLNDNDLDRLSRDAAEQYDVDQNVSTSGWEALESRLNKELPLKEEKERRRFLFWLFFIVLIAGGSLWWMLSGDNTGKNNNPPSNAVSPNPGIAHEETKTIIDKQTAQQPAETPVIDQSGSKDPNSSPLITKGNGPVGKQEPTVPEKDKATPAGMKPNARGKKNEPVVEEFVIGAMDYPERPARKYTPKKKGGKQPVAKTKDTEKAPAVDDGNGNEGVAIGNVNDGKKETSVATDKNDPAVNPVAADRKTDSTSVGQAPVEQPATIAKDSVAIVKDSTAIAKKPADKKNNKKVKGFEIGIVGGPDKSNVKFTHSSNAGYNIGLQVGYRFSNRWSVNTGLLYTKKNYKADGKDATKYGWLAGPNVDVYALEGYCSMLDIPLNVRYDFSVTPKNRFFASTGLSTYIMKNEDYDYYYKYGAVNTTYNWNTGKGGGGDSTYLFSILNLSAGFEHSLNKHFSVQAEPYLKLPLNQLGHAKLNLSSYGIYFSFKYRIAK
jgi:hypothetical protein